MSNPTTPVALVAPRVVELRQYKLHPGQRDVLIELFEREFIESQEALGMRVLGLFRDQDDPDRFVWLRGFADMPGRAAALAAFYGGPVWQRHREAANATMVDSDDVLLLRPARAGSGFGAEVAGPPPAAGATTKAPQGRITATICALQQPLRDEQLDQFERWVQPLWLEAGAELIACLATEPSPNDYPRLPVREGEPVLVWLSRFADEPARQRHAERLAAPHEWTTDVWPAWRRHLLADPTTLRLIPTQRSALQA